MIRLLAVGKLRTPELRDLSADYEQRIGRFARIEIHEIADGTRAAEAKAILAKLRGTPVVVCDLAGTGCSSGDFAAFLGNQASPCFVIGGPTGLEAAVLQRADRLLRLSDFTLPHELARVVLLEQVYRALSMLRGHPYHR